MIKINETTRNVLGLTTAIALLIGLAFCSNQASASTLEEVQMSTYKLYEGDQAICTAVAVSPTKFVTAAHCVAYDEKFSIKVGENTYGLDVVGVNFQNDTAVLEFLPTGLAVENSVFVDVAEKYDPKFGDRMFTVGYPRADVLTLTDGYFTAEVSLLDIFGVSGPFYKATVPIMGGSSGGGLYTTFMKDGQIELELVGLATASWNDVGFQSYFSTLESLQDILGE